MKGDALLEGAVLKQVEGDRGIVVVEQWPASAEDDRVDEEHQLVEQARPQQCSRDSGATDATQDDVLDVIAGFNADRRVHAVLIQYPIPRHLDYDAALQSLDPEKDVDGMHPLNMGRLAVGQPGPVPCTPAGIEALLAHHEIPVAGREVVILGRGATLGRPLAMLLAQKRPTANAAATVVHPEWRTGRATPVGPRS